MMTASQFNPPQTVRNRYMSLETEIKALAAAVIALTAKIEGINVAPAAPVAQAAPVPVAAPIPAVAPAPVAAPVAMPAVPTFVAPVAAVASGAPFNDPKGLLEYVMGAYKALGAEKGQLIQGVLTSMGYQNINDVKPVDYAQLYAGVEALKA
jgi:hypothetical protein